MIVLCARGSRIFARILQTAPRRQAASSGPVSRARTRVQRRVPQHAGESESSAPAGPCGLAVSTERNEALKKLFSVVTVLLRKGIPPPRDLRRLVLLDAHRPCPSQHSRSPRTICLLIRMSFGAARCPAAGPLLQHPGRIGQRQAQRRTPRAVLESRGTRQQRQRPTSSFRCGGC